MARRIWRQQRDRQGEVVVVFPWREVWLRVKVVEGEEGELGRFSRPCQAIGSAYNQHILIRGPWGQKGDSAARHGGSGRGVETMGQKPPGCSVAKGMTNSDVVEKMRKHPC